MVVASIGAILWWWPFDTRIPWLSPAESCRKAATCLVSVQYSNAECSRLDLLVGHHTAMALNGEWGHHSCHTELQLWEHGQLSHWHCNLHYASDLAPFLQ